MTGAAELALIAVVAGVAEPVVSVAVESADSPVVESAVVEAVEQAGSQVEALVAVAEQVAPRVGELVAAVVEAGAELGELQVAVVVSAAVEQADSQAARGAPVADWVCFPVARGASPADSASLQAGWGGLVGSADDCLVRPGDSLAALDEFRAVLDVLPADPDGFQKWVARCQAAQRWAAAPRPWLDDLC